jgi:hypothetical protein
MAPKSMDVFTIFLQKNSPDYPISGEDIATKEMPVHYFTSDIH